MSKLSEKLAGWLMNLAKKTDNSTYYRELSYIPQVPPVELITYDQWNIDKIHAQHMISEEQLKYIPDVNVDKMIAIRLAEGITDEIMKLHKDEIKKEEHTGTFGNQTLYSLDVYVCKARRKETV